MHFNDLISQLRVRTLGGIAVISALVALLSKGEGAGDFRWGILAAVFLILAIIWVAIFCLDMLYYDRLLRGAVAAITALEKTSESSLVVRHLRLSHLIEEYVSAESRWNFSGCISSGGFGSTA